MGRPLNLGNQIRNLEPKAKYFCRTLNGFVAKAWDDTWKSLRGGGGHSLRNWRPQSLMKPRVSWDWLAVDWPQLTNSKTNHKELAFLEEKYGWKLRKIHYFFFFYFDQNYKRFFCFQLADQTEIRWFLINPAVSGGGCVFLFLARSQGHRVEDFRV